MQAKRFSEIASTYKKLKIAVIGDFCLDRYLEIDPARTENSIETGLPVYNVTRVRSQPGGAGTVLNNLVALGVGNILPIGFCGDDGEGFELERALRSKEGVTLEYFIRSPRRATFTYTKPLVVFRGKASSELNRLDRKNWTVTPMALQRQLAGLIERCWDSVDAVVLLEQVDSPKTGVLTPFVLRMIRKLIRQNPALTILADSRRGLVGVRNISLKINAAELARFVGVKNTFPIEIIKFAAQQVARSNGRPVFVTLSEKGILSADPNGSIEHVEAFQVPGPIDVVGAGDAVMANLVAALTGGATAREAMTIAMAAASVVLKQLGTTGTASPRQIKDVLQRT